MSWLGRPIWHYPACTGQHAFATTKCKLVVVVVCCLVGFFSLDYSRSNVYYLFHFFYIIHTPRDTERESDGVN